MNILERLYIPEILRGLSITIRHFLKNITNTKNLRTIQYPEEKIVLPERYRAEHRLMWRPDKSIRCTACMLCATICPAKCITIEAAEAENQCIEKYPIRYDINVLRCIFCGLCVEACPCDAIRMDTGKYENASYKNPRTYIWDKEYLLNNSPQSKSPYSEGLY
jgi:NADH-quinone oxidoreductase subunit I